MVPVFGLSEADITGRLPPAGITSADLEISVSTLSNFLYMLEASLRRLTRLLEGFPFSTGYHGERAFRSLIKSFTFIRMDSAEACEFNCTLAGTGRKAFAHANRVATL